MRIMIQNSRQYTFYPALAKEIGLGESIAILAIEEKIAEIGMNKNGYRMMARDNKQMAEILPWLHSSGRKEILEALVKRNLLYIEDGTLIAKDTTRWYAINFAQLKTLESITILGDGDIEDLHEIVIAPVNANAKLDGQPQIHRDLIPVVVRMSNLTTPLTPRDFQEVQRFVKNIIKKYPDEDFDRLQKRILGIRVWHESRLDGKKIDAPRPDSAWSNWQKYGQFCRERYNGNLPPIPSEWIQETDRRK